MNFQQQLAVVEGLGVPPDTQIRMDCPFCQNKNTFTVTTTSNSIGWYCFHASCSAKGKKNGEKTMEYVNVSFKKEDIKPQEEFKLPDSFKIVHSNQKALQYLHENNCWEACMWGRADIKYDVKQDRVVFLVKNPNTNKYAGAIGRGLNSKVYPKWYMYGNKDVPFKCGLEEHKEAIIVEDCASACAVSNILTGVAILGTSLKESHKQYLKQYDKIYVGLDRDATKKSYGIANELKSYGLQNVHVKPLSDDLKYFSTEEIKEMFNG